VKIKKADDAYIEKAKKLKKEEVERLLSRMRNKLTRRTEDEKVTELEALAIQLQIEDEQLDEWREARRKVNEKNKDKDSK
jgi:hypothetical protein